MRGADFGRPHRHFWEGFGKVTSGLRVSLPGSAAGRCDDERVSRSRTMRAATLAGAGAGAWSAVLVLAVVVLIVLASWVAVPHGTSDLSDALRSGGLSFVVINGAPVHIATAWLTIPLLGLAFLPVVVVRWAVGRALRALDSSVDTMVGALIGTAVVYATMVGLVAWLASTPTAGSPPFRAAGWGAGVAIVGVLWATKAAAALRTSVADWPDGLRRTFRAAAIAVMTLVGASFVVLATAFVAGATTIIALYDSLHSGLVGSTLIFFLGLGWLPAMASWTWSWIVGSGFAVGVNTSVVPGDAHLGAVPAFPWLGALPSHAPFIGGLVFLLAVLAGALMLPALSKTGAAAVGQALSASLLVGVTGALVAWIGHGSIGPGRLGVAGPAVLSTGVHTFGYVALGSLTVVALRSATRAIRGQVASTTDDVPARVGTAA